MRRIETKIYVDRAKKDYSNKNVAKRYVAIAKEIGLWKSEEFVFSKYLKTTDIILDIGCGAGRTTLGLYNLGYKNIVGIDVTKALIKEAKNIAKEQNADISYYVDDAMALDFNDNSFDAVVFSYNGLMTIPGKENREIAIKEISRVLRPNGLFIFTTHDRENDEKWKWFWKEEQQRWESGTQDSRLVEYGDRIVEEAGEELFVHVPTIKEVYSLLAKGGLKVVSTKMRWDICATPKIEKETFGECRFFVAKKEN